MIRPRALSLQLQPQPQESAVLKRRRDATRIMYEILLLSKSGVSKTRAVQRTNLNFHLMNEYLSFLLAGEYLQRIRNGDSSSTLSLTPKGTRLLTLLDQFEEELEAFRHSRFRRQPHSTLTILRSRP